MNIIFKRKSIRTYLDIDVDDATVEQIIRAGMAAPSAKNQRPWEFYVVRNKETLQKLSACSPYGRPMVNAPVAIAACYRTNSLFVPDMVLLDMSCCCENMLIQAAALDMGSVWLSFAPLKERQEPAKKVLGLPENLEVFAVLPVGYPMGEGKPVDRFDASRIHWEE
ncbi:MAG: nitroreductase family protein [Acidaminococcaceae bacterium]|nr:nitroreductase family protein [Acidaminococcaceae bacterium]MBR1590359.1 nitroreductase family protein [Acidaminococcaceae bacterium]